MRSASLPTSELAARGPVLLKAARQVSRLHRWFGVALCLCFTLWFATGVVMIYVPFPSLGDAARIAAAQPLALAEVGLSPAQALQALGGAPVERIRLVQVLGTPRYVLTPADGPQVTVAATPGPVTVPAALTAAQATQVAEAFAGLPVVAIDGPFLHDQWTVHQRFDPARPFYRVDVADADGTSLYVSARSGEVLQRTTRFERGWNWVGAVVHWLYPTVLRKHFGAWDQTVWWLSLAGICTALMGLGLGLVRTLNLRRKQGAGLSPFRGWLHWHHVLGLAAGAVLLCWIFSGWLSMDHGRLFPVEQPDAAYPARLRGMTWPDALRGIDPGALQTLGAVHEIEFSAVGGEAVVLLRGGPWGGSSVVRARALPDASGATPLLPDALLLQAVRRASAPIDVRGIAPLADDDAYGHLRNNPLPDTTRRVTLADEGETWIHVDAASGRLISVMDRSRRLYRWLFDGLHTFDFPLLNRAGKLWQVLMLPALALGFAFSLTAVVLGMRRLRRTAKGLLSS